MAFRIQAVFSKHVKSHHLCKLFRKLKCSRKNLDFLVYTFSGLESRVKRLRS